MIIRGNGNGQKSAKSYKNVEWITIEPQIINHPLLLLSKEGWTMASPQGSNALMRMGLGRVKAVKPNFGASNLEVTKVILK